MKQQAVPDSSLGGFGIAIDGTGRDLQAMHGFSPRPLSQALILVSHSLHAAEYMRLQKRSLNVRGSSTKGRHELPCEWQDRDPFPVSLKYPMWGPVRENALLRNLVWIRRVPLCVQTTSLVSEAARKVLKGSWLPAAPHHTL